MGFLNPDDTPDAAAPASGGFLSDNPPAPPAAPGPAPAPSWSDIPLKAAVNAPGSAWEFAKNTVHPFLHPQETAENIGKLAVGVMQKMGMKEGHEYEKYPEAIGKMVMDRYGSVDNFKRTLATDPVGALSDLSIPLTLGGGALERMPSVIGKVGEVVSAAGRAADPFNAVSKAAGVVGDVGAAGAGYLTGTGMRSFQEATKAGYEGGEAGKVFRENQTGKVPGEEFVRQAHDALDNMIKERGDTYKSGMSRVGQSQQILPWNDVVQAARDADGIRKFKGIDLDPKSAELRQSLKDMVIDWMHFPPAQYHTAEGFDALKKMLSYEAEKYEKGTPQRLIADKYVHAVGETIKTNVPEYARVMEGYQQASDLVKQIERTLSLPRDERRLNVDSALRKLQSVLRRNVNTNYGQRERLVDYLEASGAPHLRAAIAGQALHSPEAHGLGRILPALASLKLSGMKEALTMGMVSPRLMGAGAYRIGQAGRVAVPAFKAAKPASYIGRYLPQEASGGAVSRALRTARRK